MKECPVCCRCFPDQVNHCPGDGESLKPTLHGDTVLDGRYQLEKRLGQGGMGIVFKARHIFLKTQHAIKVILPDLVGNDPTLATRFRQEAMAAAAIQHPNTVSVTDYGIINGTMPFLVMEFVEGRSLHDVLQLEGKLPPALALEIMLAICAGVGAAHREEIVHRDLKPLNIILKSGQTPGAGVKVLDFGLAKIKSGELLGSFVAAQTQGMMGSPYYMAPEQWGDEEIDRRADIYSLGVILYQMLAGEVPFKGNSVPSIMNKHLTAPPVPLHDRGVFVPPELEKAVRHALEKDVAARPQSMEEFVAELEEAAAAVSAAEAAAAQTEIGMRTVQIPPVDTLGGGKGVDRATALGGEQPRVVGPGTVAEAQPVAPHTGVVEEKEEAAVEPPPPDGEAAAAPEVSKATRPLTDSSLAPDGRPARGAETAHQRGGATGYHPGGADDHAAKPSHGEAPTALLDTGDEARLHANVERDRQAEEARAREAEEAHARELEEARAREAEAARLREEEERRLREEEEQRRRREEEAQTAALVGGGAAALGAGAGAAGAGGAASQVPPTGAGTSQTPPTGVGTSTTTTTTRTRVPVAAIVAAVVALLLGGAAVLAYFVVPKIIAAVGGVVEATPTPTASPTASPDPSPTPGGSLFKPELVSFPAGTYLMGRAEVPPISDQYDSNYLLWLYSQWPAHAVPVGAFEMDKTEVTNAEYAAFVRETDHPAPPGWNGNAPPAGAEQLPVSNVTYEDAEKFARWRSVRDKTTYRLPTEEEWEYAARGGDSQRMYPWGDAWEAGRANLNASEPKPVGSFPTGRTAQGLDDMIGNVWEWTSTTAAMYKGNNRTRLKESDRGKLVVRGGSYQSTHAGNEPVTVTSRRWVARDFRDPVLGFRLVRVEGRSG